MPHDATQKTPPPDGGSDRNRALAGMRTALALECAAMAAYALSKGHPFSTRLLQEMEEARGDGGGLSRLAEVHASLAALVAPATPRTLALLAEEAGRRHTFRFLGGVGLVRRMTAAGGACLCAFVLLSLTPEVNGLGKNFSLYRNHGLSLLLNELFLMSAAGAGAAFRALHEADRYVREGTYDPAYEPAYWARFVLGGFGGMLLATLIPIDLYDADKGADHALLGFGKPVLALLGGFSAQAVFRALTRLLDAVETLVRDDTEDLRAAETRAERAQAEASALESSLGALTGTDNAGLRADARSTWATSALGAGEYRHGRRGGQVSPEGYPDTSRTREP